MAEAGHPRPWERSRRSASNAGSCPQHPIQRVLDTFPCQGAGDYVHLGAKLGGSRLSFVFSDLSPIVVVCVTEASRAEAVDDASPFIPRGPAYRLVWQLPVTMPRGWRGGACPNS